MIRAELRFKNASFVNALKENGYKSIAEFSRDSNISYGTLIEYANLKKVIKNKEQRHKMIELLNSDEWTLLLQYDKIYGERFNLLYEKLSKTYEKELITKVNKK